MPVVTLTPGGFVTRAARPLLAAACVLAASCGGRPTEGTMKQASPLVLEIGKTQAAQAKLSPDARFAVESAAAGPIELSIEGREGAHWCARFTLEGPGGAVLYDDFEPGCSRYRRVRAQAEGAELEADGKGGYVLRARVPSPGRFLLTVRRAAYPDKAPSPWSFRITLAAPSAGS